MGGSYAPDSGRRKSLSEINSEVGESRFTRIEPGAVSHVFRPVLQPAPGPTRQADGESRANSRGTARQLRKSRHSIHVAFGTRLGPGKRGLRIPLPALPRSF